MFAPAAKTKSFKPTNADLIRLGFLFCSSFIEISFNIKFSEKYPDCCKLTDDDEQGGMLFEILKGRLSFRLTAPYSKERRNSLSEYAKKNGIHKGDEF